MSDFFGDNTPQPPPNNDQLYDVAVKQLLQTPTILVQADMTICDNHYDRRGVNLLKHTEAFGLPPWRSFRSTVPITEQIIEDNEAIDPKGGVTASRWHFRNDAGITGGLMRQPVDVIGGLPYTVSLWVRALTPTIVELGLRNGASQGVGSTRFVASREWKRIHDTFTSDISGIRGFWMAHNPVRDVGEVLASVDGNYLDLWGAQLEQGSVLTTYARNDASAGRATSTCEAFDAGDGHRCFFTFPSCQDKVNNKIDGDGPGAGVRSYYFMSHDRPLPTRIEEDVRPYIKTVGVAKQKIDPKNAVTRTDRMIITLIDDYKPPVFDLTKLPGLINTANAGSFGRLFLERHRNYVGRNLTIKEGFVDNRATSRARYNLGGVLYTRQDYINVAATDSYNPTAGFGMVNHGFALANKEIEADVATTMGDQRWVSAIASQIGDPTEKTLPFETVYFDPSVTASGPDWVDPDHILTSNNLDAVNTHAGSSYLLVTFGSLSDLNVPSDVVIIGLQVDIEGSAAAGAESGRRVKVEVYSDATLQVKLIGTTSLTKVIETGVDTVHVVGGPTEQWGAPQAYDRNEIFDNSSFGIGIIMDTGDAGTVNLDHVRVKVYFVGAEKRASLVTSPNGEWSNPNNAILWDTQVSTNLTPDPADLLVFKNWDFTPNDFLGDEDGTQTSLIIRVRANQNGDPVNLEVALSMDGGISARSEWVTAPNLTGTSQHHTFDQEFNIVAHDITNEDLQSSDFALLIRQKVARASPTDIDAVHIHLNRALLASPPLAHFRADVDTPGIYKVVVGVGYGDTQTLMSVMTINGITTVNDLVLETTPGDTGAPSTRHMVTQYVVADTHIDVQWVGVNDPSASRVGDGNVALVEITPASFPLSEFRSVFRGTIKEIRNKADDTWVIEATDILKKLKKNVPPRQESDAILTLTAAFTDTLLHVTDAGDYSDPDDFTVPITVVVSESPQDPTVPFEYCIVSARDTLNNTITVSRGRWGTEQLNWIVNDDSNEFKVQEVLVIGTETIEPILAAGENPVILSTKTILSPINVVDAVILLLKYGGIPTELIDEVGLLAQKDIWATGMNVLRVIDQETTVEKMLQELRDATLLQLWTTPDQIISGRFLAPPLPSDSLVVFTDEDLILSQTAVLDDDDSRLTRITYAFGFRADATDDAKTESYRNILIRIQLDSEDPRNYGDEKDKVITSRWITNSTMASIASARTLNRFRSGLREVTFRVHIQKAASLRVGDFFDLSSDTLQDAFGDDALLRQMFVIARKPVSDSVIEFTSLDAGFLRRAAFWGPSTGDGSRRYSKESVLGKRYWHQGDNVKNVVGEDRDDGYYIP